MARLQIVKKDGTGSDDDRNSVPLRDISALIVSRIDADDTGIVDAVETAVHQAILHNASDIHFEPWNDCMSVRYRIDGILHEIARIPKEYQDKVTGRIKILAGMVVYKKDIPQDGRIDGNETRCGRPMRVSTFPTVYGEKTVVRLLRSDTDLRTLDSLGFGPDVVDGLRDLISRPQGTLLLTGPSSSGKTTTMYALLRELSESRRPVPHIVTVEDPVEYRLGRVAQTQVNPHAGFTFGAALRSILRQDPEIIMVGEIRDAETAHMAIQAGLTGHLVISSIHSGTAAGVFTRLLDMGIEPFLIASSVTGVLAQRLIRVNCKQCRTPYMPDETDLSMFGIADRKMTLFKGSGCSLCEDIGYKGRTAVGELLRVNDDISELVLGRPQTRKLHDAAVRNGMRTLTEKGIALVERGTTTLDELRRVMPVYGR